MKIEATWSRLIPLKKGTANGLIYTMNVEALPTTAAAYVFVRKHGKHIVPIYIGETGSLRGRIKGHLDSLQLMRAIEGAKNGGRFLIYCTVSAKAKQKAKKHVKVIERALILHAQSEGCELVNKQGTKLPTHSITFAGNRASKAIAPRTMRLKKALADPK